MTASPLPWLRTYFQDVDWHRPYPPAPVHTLLDEAAARHPANVCTYFLGRTMTYAEIARASNHAAAGLQKLGVGKGTKVGLFLPNAPTFIVAYFAILKTGATVVNFNPLYSLPELTHQIKDSGVTLMITLDLKALFGKVEQLLASGTLERAIVASFSSLLPTIKSFLFRAMRSSDIADVTGSPQRAKIVLQTDLLANDGKPVPVTIDPATDIAVLAIHRRHHGHAQGRHAHPRQPASQRRADQRHRHRPQGRARDHHVHHPAVPCLRHDGDHELRHEAGDADRPCAEVRARRGGQTHERGEAHRAAGHPDAVQRAQQLQRHAQGRPVLAGLERFGRRGPAGGGEEDLRGADRIEARRGLWAVGDFASGDA